MPGPLPRTSASSSRRDPFPNYDGVPLGQDTKNPRIVAYISETKDAVEKKYIYVEDIYFGPDKKAVIAKSLFQDNGPR